MLFRRLELEGIAAGTITLAFRRWDRPRVSPGGRQRTAVGVIAFGDVRLVRRGAHRTSPFLAPAHAGFRCFMVASYQIPLQWRP